MINKIKSLSLRTRSLIGKIIAILAIVSVGYITHILLMDMYSHYTNVPVSCTISLIEILLSFIAFNIIPHNPNKNKNRIAGTVVILFEVLQPLTFLLIFILLVQVAMYNYWIIICGVLMFISVYFIIDNLIVRNLGELNENDSEKGEDT